MGCSGDTPTPSYPPTPDEVAAEAAARAREQRVNTCSHNDPEYRDAKAELMRLHKALESAQRDVHIAAQRARARAEAAECLREAEEAATQARARFANLAASSACSTCIAMGRRGALNHKPARSCLDG